MQYETYITQIKSVFVHPSELIYILEDSKGNIRVYDIPTMALIGKTCFTFKQSNSDMLTDDSYSVYKCMFSK